MADLATKNLTVDDEEDHTRVAKPAEFRTGGQDVLTARIRAVFGMGRYEALMSGVATSTHMGYTKHLYE